jgi:hypothetical protein
MEHKKLSIRRRRIIYPYKIRYAVMAMHVDKAPGPDGFISNFFKSAWVIVGPYL